MTTNAQLVLERIERAFAKVRLEDGVSLREADVIDDYGTEQQRKDARRLDEQLDWRRIPDDLLEQYWASLSFFDAKGMQFHLPAYMRFAVRHYRTSNANCIDSTIFTLGYNDDKFSLFTPPQRAAVRHFLKLMAHNGGRFVDCEDAERALNEVWLKPMIRTRKG